MYWILWFAIWKSAAPQTDAGTLKKEKTPFEE
jgi:hypothetical protein